MLRKHTQPHCQIWKLSMFARLPLIPNPIVTYQIFQCLPSCQKIWNLSMFAQLSNTKSSNVYQTAAYRLYRIFQRLRECWLYWIFERLPECLSCCSPTRHTSFCPTSSCNKAGQTRQATLHSQSHKQISQSIQQEKMGEIADRNQNRRMEKLWHLRSTQQISFCIQIPGLTLKSKRHHQSTLGWGSCVINQHGRLLPWSNEENLDNDWTIYILQNEEKETSKAGINRL